MKSYPYYYPTNDKWQVDVHQSGNTLVKSFDTFSLALEYYKQAVHLPADVD